MRKEIEVRIQDDSRDKDKLFLIREMPATKGERWAIKALLALGRSNQSLAEIPDEIINGGMATLSKVGIAMFMKLEGEDAIELLDELWTCVSIKPNKSDPSMSRPLIEEDIEEISTRIKLKIETLKLHLDFLKAGM